MISKRLQNIISFIPSCQIAADIGCDHGYIGVELLKKNICQKVIFSDISKDSLEKAKKLAKLENVFDRAEFFVSDGLEHIEKAVDVAVIAGMGGKETEKILTGAICKANFFVLQPMKNAYFLRKWLFEQNLFVKIDKKILDNDKFYDIILVDPLKKEKNSAYNFKFGMTDLEVRGEVFLQFLQKELVRCSQHPNLTDYKKSIEELLWKQ